MRAAYIIALLLAFVACSEAFMHSSALPLRARNAPKTTCIKMSDHNEGEPKQATRGGENIDACGSLIVAAKASSISFHTVGTRS
jgi:hypothetical protein